MIRRLHLSHIFRVTKTVIRAGIIPYTFINNDIYWLMGINVRGKLSDFGGGRHVKHEELPVNCILRELDEETSGVLTNYVQQSIENGESLALFGRYNRKGNLNDYLLFAPIAFLDYNALFKRNAEILQLIWISQKHVLEADRLHEPIIRYIKHFRKLAHVKSNKSTRHFNKRVSPSSK